MEKVSTRYLTILGDSTFCFGRKPIASSSFMCRSHQFISVVTVMPALSASYDLLIAFITLWFLSCYSMVYDVLTYGLRCVNRWFPE